VAKSEERAVDELIAYAQKIYGAKVSIGQYDFKDNALFIGLIIKKKIGGENRMDMEEVKTEDQNKPEEATPETPVEQEKPAEAPAEEPKPEGEGGDAA